MSATASIILCPGQGAQAVGMGRAWAASSPEARAVFDRADRVLGGRLGAPLSRLCFDGPADQLNRTDISQPAIYVTGFACWKALLARWGYGNGETPLGASAGLSLGEYTALALAGAIDFEAGLELVVLRGRAMQDAAESQRGGMVALIGADEALAESVCAAARGGDVLVCANFNAPGQIVLSGSAEACARAAGAASAMGLRATPLAVAGAFHSPLMQPAADILKAALDSTDFRTPRCPVYSNVTAAPHDTPSIRARLVEQLTSPVRWSPSCAAMLAAHPGLPIHELAPGKTLAGLMRRIDKAAKVQSHEEPDDPARS